MSSGRSHGRVLERWGLDVGLREGSAGLKDRGRCWAPARGYELGTLSVSPNAMGKGSFFGDLDMGEHCKVIAVCLSLPSFHKPACIAFCQTWGIGWRASGQMCISFSAPRMCQVLWVIARSCALVELPARQQGLM